MNGPAVNGPLALYVHWPFCLSKCPYCDFNSHVGEDIDQARWRRAFLSELDHLAHQVPDRRLASLYFGGGTPSLMAPATVEAVIGRAHEHWPAHGDLEVTLEANPSSAEARRFRDFRSAGVERLSLGVQALDDDALRFLGRGHDRSQALAALDAAKRIFPRVSFDLIYARPDQTAGAWRRELDEALALARGHLSLYQLTIEKGTPFYAAARAGRLTLPEQDSLATLFEITQERLEAAGLRAYEVSSHAEAGEECRHNLTYWRYEDYAGIGPGAHGRLRLDGTIVATRRRSRPEDWLAAVEADGHGAIEETPIGPDRAVAEAAMMGLRTAEGLSAERFERRTGRAFEDAFERKALGTLIEGGYLVLDGKGLRATPAGRRVLNAVLARLIA